MRASKALYQPRADREEHLRVLKGLIAHILAFNCSVELAKYKREAIDRLLWKLTEIDGKYGTRFRSEGALQVDRRDDRRREAGDRVLQHEHVYTRSWLTTQLLQRPADADSILDLAIGCVVTKAEHERLKKTGDREGWQRYRTAGIRVFDLASGRAELLSETT